MAVVSKNLKYFVASLVAGAALLLLASYWLGTNLIYLAFFDPQRSEPMLVLQGGGEQASKHAQRATWLAEFNANQQGVFSHVYSAEGRESDQVTALAVIKFNAGSDAVRVLTDLDYPSDQGDHADLVLATYELFGEALPQVMVLWLAQRSLDQVVNPLNALHEHSQIGSSVYWRGRFTSLRGAQWDDALILGFASTREATAWLGADETRLLRELIGARSQNLLVSVFETYTED